MPNLVLLAFIGLAAQLVDGGLGMGYGVISTSLLVVAGLTPAAASAAVHLAKIGTGLASGVAHWRFGNVDWRVAARIGLPGALGGFLGATLLSALPGEVAAPWMAVILLALGIGILVRFSVPRTRPASPHPLRARFLMPLGLFAGTVDATGGGGWGPVATPSLLATDRLAPAKVVGTVNAAEFAVAVATSIGFLVSLDGDSIGWSVAAALLVGGAIAAPFAAWLVRKLPGRQLGIAVGGLIIATNLRTVLLALDAPGWTVYAGFAAALAAWALAFRALRRAGRPARDTAEAVPATETV